MGTPKPSSSGLQRRAFLKGAGAATAAVLTIGFEWAGSARQASASASASAGPPNTAAPFAPNAFVRIGSDNSITIVAKHIEMGQGSYTGLATILADELDADWTQVRVESAPADAERYYNSVFGKIQGTGGSSAIANSWLLAISGLGFASMKYSVPSAARRKSMRAYPSRPSVR